MISDRVAITEIGFATASFPPRSNNYLIKSAPKLNTLHQELTSVLKLLEPCAQNFKASDMNYNIMKPIVR